MISDREPQNYRAKQIFTKRRDRCRKAIEDVSDKKRQN